MISSLLYPFIAILASAVALPTTISEPLSKRDAVEGAADYSFLSPDKTWYYVSEDGSEITKIGDLRPQSFLTAPDKNGHAYYFGFSNEHGALTPRPALAKLLFECEFYLFDLIPASGKGVWEPAAGGHYNCENGNAPGTTLKVDLQHNSIDYVMAFHDLAFVLKVLHDTKGVLDSTQYFDFEFLYTNEQATHEAVSVMKGSWDKTAPVSTA